MIILLDLAIAALYAYGGWRLWRVHGEQLGLVMLIVIGLTMLVAVFAVLFAGFTFY